LIDHKFLENCENCKKKLTNQKKAVLKSGKKFPPKVFLSQKIGEILIVERDFATKCSFLFLEV
jgi:hypothetical protein